MLRPATDEIQEVLNIEPTDSGRMSEELQPGTGEASGLGRCAKIVGTRATNVLGYVRGVRGQDWLGVHDGCGHRPIMPEDEDDIYNDAVHIHNPSFFNESTDLPFTLAQLEDLRNSTKKLSYSKRLTHGQLPSGGHHVHMVNPEGCAKAIEEWTAANPE